MSMTYRNTVYITFTSGGVMITHFFYIVSVYKDTKLRTRLDLSSVVKHFVSFQS